ncbi:MAG: RNA polymerase sigma factor [Spirochaetia bacterium]|nr:RNA polymerase sigma factor [Spirochaetia bacterium]
MTKQEIEFTNIVKETKIVVLNAISKTLNPEFSSMIDDIVQETYLRAHKSLKKNQFRYEASYSTWLYTIAKNEALRMNKKLMRRQRLEQELNENIVEGKSDSIYQNMETSHRETHKLETMKRIISTLPAKYKAVLELDILGFKDWQIAEKLNINPGTVKSRNSRAREKVRQWIHQMKTT